MEKDCNRTPKGPLTVRSGRTYSQCLCYTLGQPICVYTQSSFLDTILLYKPEIDSCPVDSFFFLEIEKWTYFVALYVYVDILSYLLNTTENSFN